MKLARGMANEFGNGLGDFEFFLHPGTRKFGDAGFGFFDDARHHGDGFDRILSGGGFGRKHHGIGTIENRIGDIGSFRAGGARVRGHGFEHLGGGDYGTAGFAGAGNNHLLYDGYALGVHLYAEVATGNHYAVGDAQDSVQIFDRFGFFELGDYGSVFAGAANEIFREHDVFGMADETHRYVIGVLLESKDQVFAIFRCQRGNAELNTRQIDSFVLAEQAAVHDFA